MKTSAQKDPWTFILMAALFTLVKRWKAPGVPFRGGMAKVVVV